MRPVVPRATVQTTEAGDLAMQAHTERVRVGLTARGPAPVLSLPVTFTAGQTVTFAHRLGRLPAEWSAIDVVDGYGSFRRVSWDARTITVQSQHACTARFRVA